MLKKRRYEERTPKRTPEVVDKTRAMNTRDDGESLFDEGVVKNLPCGKKS